MLSRTEKQILGKTDLELFDLASAQMMISRDLHIRSSSRIARYASIARANGQWMRFESVKVPVASQFGTGVTTIGISQTIDSKLTTDTQDLLSRLAEMAMRDRSAFYASYLSWQFNSAGSLRYPTEVENLFRKTNRLAQFFSEIGTHKQ